MITFAPKQGRAPMVLFLRAAVCALVFASSAPIFTETASAQSYPSHSVRMLVPFAAAGPTDVIARILAQKLSDNLGQQFYVENVPGGGGNTGTAPGRKVCATTAIRIFVREHRFHHQSEPLCQGALQSNAGFCAGHAGGSVAQRAERRTRGCRRSRSRSSSTSSRPIPASTVSLNPRPVRLRICLANCSN